MNPSSHQAPSTNAQSAEQPTTEQSTISPKSASPADSTRQSPRWLWLLGLLCLITGGGIAWWWLRPSPSQPQTVTAAPDPVPVAVGQAQLASAVGDRTLSGTVEAAESVTLTSRVRGQILRLPVEEGDVVQSEQLLAEIDVRDILAQQRRAEASVAQARTAVSVAQSARTAAQAQLDQARARRQEAVGQLAEAEAERDQARLDQERFAFLAAQGAVPQSQSDQANTRLATVAARIEQIRSAIAQAEAAIGRAQSQVAQANQEVDRAREGVNAAQAGVREVQANLDYGLLQAPFAGVVTQTHSEVGTLAGPGQPIVTLENPEQLQFTVSVPASLITQIEPQQTMPVQIDALDQTLQGRVEQVIPAADPRSHSFTVKLDLPADPALISGMFGQLQLTPTGPNTRQMVMIPADAVVERMGLVGVFVIDAGTAQFQQITTGEHRADRVEVFSGLAAGDRLILQPADAIRDDVAVTPRS